MLYICVYMRSLLNLTPNPQIGIKICSILGRPLSKKGKRNEAQNFFVQRARRV